MAPPLLHRAAINTVSGKVVAQSIAFRVVSIYWQGVAPPIGSTWWLAVLSADAGLLVIMYVYHFSNVLKIKTL